MYSRAAPILNFLFAEITASSMPIGASSKSENSLANGFACVFPGFNYKRHKVVILSNVGIFKPFAVIESSTELTIILLKSISKTVISSIS